MDEHLYSLHLFRHERLIRQFRLLVPRPSLEHEGLLTLRSRATATSLLLGSVHNAIRLHLEVRVHLSGVHDVGELGSLAMPPESMLLDVEKFEGGMFDALREADDKVSDHWLRATEHVRASLETHPELKQWIAGDVPPERGGRQ